jgi:hypothetical protein
MIRLLDDSFGGTQGVVEDKIRQVGVFQRHRTQEQRFFLSPNPQGHPVVVFNRYSWHGGDLHVRIKIVHYDAAEVQPAWFCCPHCAVVGRRIAACTVIGAMVTQETESIDSYSGTALCETQTLSDLLSIT